MDSPLIHITSEALMTAVTLPPDLMVDLGMLPVIGLELPSTMHEWASSLLERSEGFFRRNGGKNFDVIEWIFRLGR